MTTLELYRKHKAGEVSREKFLYEVRRDINIPWVLNTTSYDDAVIILKNKGIISEDNSTLTKGVGKVVEPSSIKMVEEKFYSRDYVSKKYGVDKAKEIEANIEDEEDNNPNIWDLYTSLETPEEVDDFVKGFIDESLTEAKKSKKKQPKELHIDVANPYEYRHGIQYELECLDDYSAEALEKAKSKVLKNLGKDPLFYSTLLNQKQSPYKFKAPETDKPGMQANADGTLKKGAGKVEKANVKDTLGKKEEGTKNPKGVKEMTMTPKKAKGIKKTMALPGKEKTIKLKEGVLNEVILKVYHYDPSSNDLEDVEVEYFGSEDEAKKAALAHHWQIAFDNGDTDLSKDEFVAQTNWEDLEPYENYGYDIVPDKGNIKENIKEHHNDPNFPGGQAIYDLLDTVATDWGKEDLYQELEDVIVAYSDNGRLSNAGLARLKGVLSNYDVLDDYQYLLDKVVVKEGLKLMDFFLGEDKAMFMDMPADPEKYQIKKDLKGNIVQATNDEGNTFSKNDEAIAIDNGEKIKIADFTEEQGKVKALYSAGMFFSSIDIDGLKPVNKGFRPGVDLGKSFEKLKAMKEYIKSKLKTEDAAKDTQAKQAAIVASGKELDALRSQMSSLTNDASLNPDEKNKKKAFLQSKINDATKRMSDLKSGKVTYP